MIALTFLKVCLLLISIEIFTPELVCTKVRVVRIFNTYGPRMALDDGRVVSNFVAQALTDQDLTVYGDGQQTRSFQYVSDLIKGKLSSTWCLPVALGQQCIPGCRLFSEDCCNLTTAFVAVYTYATTYIQCLAYGSPALLMNYVLGCNYLLGLQDLPCLCYIMCSKGC